MLIKNKENSELKESLFNSIKILFVPKYFAF